MTPELEPCCIHGRLLSERCRDCRAHFYGAREMPDKSVSIAEIRALRDRLAEVEREKNQAMQCWHEQSAQLAEAVAAAGEMRTVLQDVAAYHCDCIGGHKSGCIADRASTALRSDAGKRAVAWKEQAKRTLQSVRDGDHPLVGNPARWNSTIDALLADHIAPDSSVIHP